MASFGRTGLDRSRTVARRRAAAADLRARGASWEEVGLVLGLTPRTAERLALDRRAWDRELAAARVQRADELFYTALDQLRERSAAGDPAAQQLVDRYGGEDL